MSEYLRQLDIINQEKLSQTKIAIVGTGAIGSFTALALTKMGAKRLTLWDKDKVEVHNISNQLYNKDSLGLPKVVSAAKECQRFTPDTVDVECRNEMYSGQNLEIFDIVIALTDNIEGRKAVFEASQKSPQTSLFIDGRMGGELFRVFAFNPKDSVKAKKYYTDYIEGVINEELPCSARAIIYNVLMASSMIASYVKKHVNGESMPFEFIFNFVDYNQAKRMSL